MNGAFQKSQHRSSHRSYPFVHLRGGNHKFILIMSMSVCLIFLLCKRLNISIRENL